MKTYTYACFIALFFLSGCGGGAGNQTINPPANTPQVMQDCGGNQTQGNFMSVQALLIAMTGASWDISTMLYSGKSLNVNAQLGNPNSISFSQDGTKAYVVGIGTAICQYSLSIPWDISTGSYASKSLNTSAQSSTIVGLFFSPDGTKVFVLTQGLNTTTTYQYTLSTPWDISTGTYASKSLVTTSQDQQGYGLYFSPDGTKVFIAGHQNATLYQYALGVAWDISTGSYASKSLNASTQLGGSNALGISLSVDGTKVYANNSSYNFQYTLTVPFDLSSGSYSGKSFLQTQTSNAYGLFFNPIGLQAYMAGIGDGKLYQYSLQ